MPTSPPDVTWSVQRGLDRTELAAVVRLSDTEVDRLGEEPLSDAARLALHATAPTAWHCLIRDRSGLAGYLQVRAEGAGLVAELAAAPRLDLSGVPARALERIRDEVGEPVTLWVRGQHDPARMIVRSLDMEPVRTLLQMRAELAPALPPAPLPPAGLMLRTFVVGSDEQAWLAANRAAFTELPDQGGWTRTDLASRIAAPWFRPEGFFLLVTEADQIAGFHWTKIQPAADCGCPADCGEIYVLAVVPGFQGRGIGSYLTHIGLDYFRDSRIRTAMLYVDESNTAAVNTYQRQGFSIFSAARQYELP